jgi:hypothetical protein
MDQPMTERMRKDLEELISLFKKRSWRPEAVPIIGSPDCPILAEKYGDRGRSCYVVFVYKKANGKYGCRHERCFRDGEGGPSFRSTEEAIHHQHLNHF